MLNNIYQRLKCNFFQVYCFDLGNPRLFSEQTALVTIHVRDANDTVPTFTHAHYNLNLLLPTVEGVIVSREIHVAKPDPFQKFKPLLTYLISGGNENLAFQIDSQNGVLSVFDPSSLENNQKFNLRVRVTDGKRSSTAKVTVSVASISTEDGLPFTRNVYEAIVTENSTKVSKMEKPLIIQSKFLLLVVCLHFSLIFHAST